MFSGTPSCSVAGLTVVACLMVAASVGEAQGLRVENFFPHQLPVGQATLVSMVIPSPDAVEGTEIMPAAGMDQAGEATRVKVTDVTRGAPANARGDTGGAMWWEMTIDVAPDAMPGERTLVVVMAGGRRLPAVTFMIPDHVPGISDLRVMPDPSSPSTIELEFAVADVAADLGESPYVWFSTACGDEPLPGVVHGKLTANDADAPVARWPRTAGSGVVRASVAVPPAGAGGVAPAVRTCEVRVRVADSVGFESNTLQATVDVKN